VLEELVGEELGRPKPGVEPAILQSLDKEEEIDEETNLNVRWLGMSKE
jgi:hypothetical protein